MHVRSGVRSRRDYFRRADADASGGGSQVPKDGSGCFMKVLFECFDEPIDALDVGGVGSLQVDNVATGQVFCESVDRPSQPVEVLVGDRVLARPGALTTAGASTRG